MSGDLVGAAIAGIQSNHIISTIKHFALNGQDALIAAVAPANPNTIVVLETGGPVLMPWLDKVAGVVEAWYPGARLPVTFPASLDQLPRPKLDGADWVEPNFGGDPAPGKDQLHADYDIEGSDVGYRWFARKGLKPLFPFGFGLSYTSFAARDLKVSGLSASFTLAKTGQRAGDYGFALGRSATDLGPVVTVRLPARTWKD